MIVMICIKEDNSLCFCWLKPLKSFCILKGIFDWFISNFYEQIEQFLVILVGGVGNRFGQ